MSETTRFTIEEDRTLGCETSVNRRISIKDHIQFIKFSWQCIISVSCGSGCHKYCYFLTFEENND